VWRATDTVLGRQVAIKILPDAFAREPERLARFEREARILASLNHSNIATIHGLEKSADHCALVMELVEGPTLADRVKDGPITVAEALAIATEIAEALEAAHERGIIHRDLKPANVKVRLDGTVKVLDFGLAKAVEPAGSAVAATMSPTITTPAMTQLGMILGTAAYMSPEQAKGRDADKRSDIWAFGVTLFEMLTGKRAFDGDDVSDALASVLKTEPDWTVIPTDVPQPLRALLRRCLVKDRRQRVSDISTVLFVLREQNQLATTTTASAPTTAITPRERWHWVVPAVAATVLTAVIVGAIAWAFRPLVPAAPLARFSFALPEGGFTGTSRRMVAISRDGTHLAFIANSRLYVRSLSDFEARVLVGTEAGDGILNPVFSPDGTSVAFYSVNDQTIKRVSVAGGAPVTVCALTGSPLGMSWGDDGIVFGAAGDPSPLVPGSASTEGRWILRVSANGGTPEPLITLKEDELANEPQILPGGRAVLFTFTKSTLPVKERWEKAEIVMQSLDDGTRTKLVTGSHGRYLTTGHLIYAVGGLLYAVPFDARQQNVIAAPVPVLEGVRRSIFATGTGAAQFDVSDTGTLVYVPGPTSITSARALSIADRSGKRTPLPLPPGPYLHPRVSRDSKYLALERDDGKEANVLIYDMSTASAIRRLTFEGRNRFPIWSPDGSRVAFQSDRDGDRAIFAQAIDGSDVRRLTKPEANVSHVPESWSPDGRTLLFTAVHDDKYSLWALSLNDGKVNAFGGVQSLQTIGASFSPDGRWVAYSTSDVAGGTPSPNRGIYLQPFPSTGTRAQLPKVSRDFHPAWSSDGKELFYLPIAGGFVAVSVQNTPTLVFGRPTSLSPVTTDRISSEVRDYDVMRDGRFVTTSAAEAEGLETAAGSQIRVTLNWFEELRRLVPSLSP
jgi:serine/threonine-protein kinase